MELTPKQKAEELVYFYQNLLTPLSEKKDDFFFSRCKKCALIAVDEIINSLENYGKESDELQNMENDFRYWQEVRQELLNMK